MNYRPTLIRRPSLPAIARLFNKSISLVIFAEIIFLIAIVNIEATKSQLLPSTITLEGIVYLPPSASASSTQLVLNNGQYSVSPLPLDGIFAISDIFPGLYLLEIRNPTYSYSQVLIEVSYRPISLPKVAAYLYDIEHGKGARLKYPLRLSPDGTYTFFLSEPSMNILGLFKNPMVLIGLVSLGLMGIMSKVHASVDPEELQSLTGAGSALFPVIVICVTDEPQYKSSFIERLLNNRPIISGGRTIRSNGRTPNDLTIQSQRPANSTSSKRKKK